MEVLLQLAERRQRSEDVHAAVDRRGVDAVDAQAAALKGCSPLLRRQWHVAVRHLRNAELEVVDGEGRAAAVELRQVRGVLRHTLDKVDSEGVRDLLSGGHGEFQRISFLFFQMWRALQQKKNRLKRSSVRK